MGGKPHSWDAYVKLMGKCDVCGGNNAEHGIFEEIYCGSVRRWRNWCREHMAKAVFYGQPPFRRYRHRKLVALAKIGVWFGFAMALLGSFEQALQASGSPFWSSVFGLPVLHHYLVGFVILAVSLLILEFRRVQDE